MGHGVKDGSEKILFPLLRESHNREWLVKKTKLIDPLVHVMCKNVFTTEIAPRESARAHRGRKEETGASTESASTMATLCRSRVAVSTVAATRAQLGPGLLARILSHGGNRGGGSQGAARRGREIHGRISSFWDGRPQCGFPFFCFAFLFTSRPCQAKIIWQYVLGEMQAGVIHALWR